MVKAHPADLFKQTIEFQLQSILDEEDLGRAVLRKEVLFYHQVAEEAIDHFLQALFAINNTYFPSRKRTEGYLEGFAKKPGNCYQRLLQIVKDGSSEETIEKSIEELRSLTKELEQLT